MIGYLCAMKVVVDLDTHVSLEDWLLWLKRVRVFYQVEKSKNMVAAARVLCTSRYTLYRVVALGIPSMPESFQGVGEDDPPG